MARRNKYTGQQRLQMQRKAGAILLAGKRSGSKVSFDAAKKTADRIVKDSLSTVEVKARKKPKTTVKSRSQKMKREVAKYK